MALRQENVEITAIWERLKERGYTGRYDAVRRLEPTTLDVTVRVECTPGEEAQADFGYAGLMLDPDIGRCLKQLIRLADRVSSANGQVV
ncbi:MAG: hypothetical protein R6X34_24035 [Chloroflexota bacterium]